jgi:protease-4
MPMPPAPRGGGGGFARAIFTALAIMILTASVSLNFYLLVFQGVIGGGSVSKHVINEGDAANTIAIIEIEGVIDAAASDHFAETLKHVQADSSVKALVIKMNTPGGTVTASDEIYSRILRLRKDQNIPVYVSMREMATSGGYFVACAADRVFAEQTTWTGNIGVLIPRISLVKLGEKYGIEDATVVSTGSNFKHVGSMWKQDTAEQQVYLQGLADEAAAVFKNVVMQGRKMDAATVSKVADGQVYTGSKALALKLVDDIGTLDDALAAAAKHLGLTGPQIVQYSLRPSFFDALAGGNRQGNDLFGIKSGNLDVSVDSELIKQLGGAGRPMYLWQGH